MIYFSRLVLFSRYKETIFKMQFYHCNYIDFTCLYYLLLLY